jgi:hypothetical protein
MKPDWITSGQGTTEARKVDLRVSIRLLLPNGTLSISGLVTGDIFPGSEAFVADQSGTRVFLGAKLEAGGVTDLVGDNQQPLFEVNMQIRFDKNGNFKAVIADGKTYSIKAWNEKVKGKF